ncbi:MAG: sulfurtransferase complex subunit TusC [Methylococcaceae bacterium]|nr:sulfurtransferase complex subunit TusC [Methylococcaceae bacterium]MCI0734249.1 sulfurtransferase complex subunit TusC [Methylococcaceae bacterium]
METRFMFVFARPPHASLHVQEMLDLTLTAAAFDRPVSLLLIDDGVYSLKSGQQPCLLDCKDIVPVFESLAFYDVEHIYAETESLRERGLFPGDLGLPVELLSRSEIGAVMARQSVIVNV